MDDKLYHLCGKSASEWLKTARNKSYLVFRSGSLTEFLSFRSSPHKSSIISIFAFFKHLRQYGCAGMSWSMIGQKATAGLPHTQHLQSLAYFAGMILQFHWLWNKSFLFFYPCEFSAAMWANACHPTSHINFTIAVWA